MMDFFHLLVITHVLIVEFTFSLQVTAVWHRQNTGFTFTDYAQIVIENPEENMGLCAWSCASRPDCVGFLPSQDPLGQCSMMMRTTATLMERYLPGADSPSSYIKFPLGKMY